VYAGGCGLLGIDARDSGSISYLSLVICQSSFTTKIEPQWRGPIPERGKMPTRLPALIAVALAALSLLGALRAAEDDANLEHWAFRPPSRPAPPMVKRADRVLTPIDRFVLAKLEAKGLSLSPPADKTMLIRRVSFDVTGLPPTPEAIARFLADRSDDAYEKMVDRYLASPRYGERWGKFWLDAAGYADSNGYFSADTDRPLAYHYRDYVIRSLNADKPLDQFVREQLAGDELAGWDGKSDLTPAMRNMLIATHYLRNSQDGTGESDGNPDEVTIDRYTVLEGTVQIIGSSLLGLTVHCARCHDHKFEAFSQREYYGLQAMIYPAFNLTRWVTPNKRVIFAPNKKQLADWEVANKRIDAKIAAMRSEKNVAKRKNLDEQIKKIEKQRQAKPGKIAWVTDLAAEPPDVPLLVRGNYKIHGENVRPVALAALDEPSNPFNLEKTAAETPRTTGRRLAFARWLTKRDSRAAALLARVLANRIWQNHFGRGIVATADNLGEAGELPTHEGLLNYLAWQLADGGWKAKSLHRMILRSAVYRQSSRPRAEAKKIDPDELLLWRFPLRRLDAESIRDAMLAAAGELDVRMAGPYVPTRRTGVGEVVVDEKRDGARRRSVYLQSRRTQIASLLETFDAPSVVFSCTRRTPTTIPLQSLSLLNSDFARRRAKALAARVAREAGAQTDNRIDRAFLITLGRKPSKSEHAASEEFIKKQPAQYKDQPDAEQRAWIDLCQALMASNAFLYVE
jgi:hypothetical protein